MYATLLRKSRQCICTRFTNVPLAVIEEGNDPRNGRPTGLSKLGYNAHQLRSGQFSGYSTLLQKFRQCIYTCCTNIAVSVFEEGNNLRNGRLDELSKLSYKARQRHSEQKIVYTTLVREFRQCICTCFTSVPVTVIEEGDDLRNGRPYGLSKLSSNAPQWGSSQKIGYSTLL